MASKHRPATPPRATANSDAPPPAARPHPGLIGASLLSSVIAIFMLSASLREIFVAINRTEYVREEAVILTWDFAPARASSPRGMILSSKEEFLIDRLSIMDLDHAKALESAGKLEGYRTPVYYLPPRSPWSTIDNVIAFRIQSPEQFELGFAPGLLATNVGLAILAVVLFRRGLRR